jgi:hypothetical protein
MVFFGSLNLNMVLITLFYKINNFGPTLKNGEI